MIPLEIRNIIIKSSNSIINTVATFEMFTGKVVNNYSYDPIYNFIELSLSGDSVKIIGRSNESLLIQGYRMSIAN